MVAGNPVNSIGFTNPGAVEVSPVTEFLTTGGEDRLFASAELPSSGNVVSLQINNPPTVSVFPTGLENFSPVQYGTGASGIVADNTASTVGQANSIYFGAFGTTGTDANASTVVKLTQVDLN
jgi:hypothetical protein